MIPLRVPTAPPCLGAFAAHEPPPAFDGIAFQNCKAEVRRRLISNQRDQCAHCERPIINDGKSCQIDHLVPQVTRPDLRFEISNMVASCQSEDTCGHKHGAGEVPAGLNPYRVPSIHLAFRCDTKGELHAHNVSVPDSDFAFKSLNLNSPALRSQRTLVITKLMSQTINLGRNARQRIHRLRANGVGFESLHFQILGPLGFPEPRS